MQTLAASLPAMPADAPRVPFGEAEREAATAALLAESRAADARSAWDKACPPIMRESDWTRPELAKHRAAIDRVLAWRPAPRGTPCKGILAAGETGRAKTRAMFALCRTLTHDLTPPLAVRFYHAQEWFSRLQQEIRYGDDGDAAKWVAAIAALHIVFIDDLGQQAVAQARAEWSQGWFFRFLDLRSGNGLPLLVTTNLTATELAETSNGKAGVRGDPLVRRLLAVAEPIKF